MPTSWSYDPDVDAADIDLCPPPCLVAEPLRTVDLGGAHVLLDVDAAGNVVSVEILGPCRDFALADLGRYLLTLPNQ